MNPKDRVVVRMPLTEIWNDTGTLQASKESDLTLEEIKEMIRVGPVQFIVANVGYKLEWVDLADTFSFWKDELKQHLCSNDRAFLEDYPDNYFYFASGWQLESGEKVIVLEKQH